MATKHPVIMYQLQPNDEGYDKGARFRLVTVDGDGFYFPTREDADAFITRHGMKHINEPEMAALREALKGGGE